MLLEAAAAVAGSRDIDDMCQPCSKVASSAQPLECPPQTSWKPSRSSRTSSASLISPSRAVARALKDKMAIFKSEVQKESNVFATPAGERERERETKTVK